MQWETCDACVLVCQFVIGRVLLSLLAVVDTDIRSSSVHSLVRPVLCYAAHSVGFSPCGFWGLE